MHAYSCGGFELKAKPVEFQESIYCSKIANLQFALEHLVSQGVIKLTG